MLTVSTSHRAIPFTYEVCKPLTESSDQRYELIDGGLYMNPSPSVRHQSVSIRLTTLLQQHLATMRCGREFNAPLGVVLGPDDKRSVVRPDILFVSNERAGIIEDNEIVGAPNLVVDLAIADLFADP